MPKLFFMACVLLASVSSLQQLNQDIDARLHQDTFVPRSEEIDTIKNQMITQHQKTLPDTDIRLAPEPTCGL